jgi:hypothetical protein
VGLRDQKLSGFNQGIVTRDRYWVLSVTHHVHPTGTLSLAQLGHRWLLSFISPLEATTNPFNEFQASYCIHLLGTALQL